MDFKVVVRPSAVKVNQRVRLVEMRGCMAHVRGEVLEGTVITIEAKRVYGSVSFRPWATIQLDSGGLTDRCAERNNWTPNETDGVMEYRY